MIVFCNGMIRSGSTQQHNIVARLVERCGGGRDEGFVPGYEFDANLERFRRWSEDDELHVVKTHDAFTAELNGRVKMVYIHRDLRDVAASSIKKWKLEGDKLFEVLDEALENYRVIQAQAPLLSQRYDDVMGNRYAAIKEIGAFLELAPTEKDLRWVERETSMDSALDTMRTLKRRPWVRLAMFAERLGISLKSYDGHSLLHHNHVSETRGTSVWEQELTDEQKRGIAERYGDWLHANGYT